MSMMNRLQQVLGTLLFGCALCTLATAAGLPAESAAKHVGVATCAASQCHGSAIPREATGVLQNEYVTWTQADPHARAYEVLSNDASRRIAARLGIANARNAEECLDCHADNVASATARREISAIRRRRLRSLSRRRRALAREPLQCRQRQPRRQPGRRHVSDQ